MTNYLIYIGWVMSCAGIGFSFLAALYIRDWITWLAVVYFLGCAVASSVLRSAYEHYRGTEP